MGHIFGCFKNGFLIISIFSCIGCNKSSNITVPSCFPITVELDNQQPWSECMSMMFDSNTESVCINRILTLSVYVSVGNIHSHLLCFLVMDSSCTSVIPLPPCDGFLFL